MARRSKNDEDLLMVEDELTAAFLEDDAVNTQVAVDPVADNDDQIDEIEEELPGTLAVDVYETPEQLMVKARTAGVNRDELDVSIADNTLTIRGTLSSGDEVEAENFHVQECYWGEFSRTLALPVGVREDEIDAVLKDGVLTITFTKIKQDTIKKIEIK